MEFLHQSVLLKEAVDALAVKPNGVYVDGTAGGGGHSLRIVRQLSIGRLLAIDKDPQAVTVLKERLVGLPAQVVRADFCEIPSVLEDQGISQVDGILLDLGVSSHQLDTAARGFSYHTDAPLDMRMSMEGMSAYDLVNTWESDRIAHVLWDYGEEKFARRIAQNIVRERARAPISTTLQLSTIIRDSIPAPARRTGGNPAKRSFQAIRIAVNAELDAVRLCIEHAFGCLAPDGRFAIITFHSLEDRIVKQAFAGLCKGCTCPPDCPICICGHEPAAKAITRKPLTPGDEELSINPRARSAKLRVIERLATSGL